MSRQVLIKIDLNKLQTYDTSQLTTACRSEFRGILVNQCYNTFYFELEDKTMVAVPIEWVRWMAPLEEIKEVEKKHG